MNNLAKKFHQDAAHMAENVALRNVIATGLGKYAEGRDKKIADFQDWQKARETASQIKRESLKAYDNLKNMTKEDLEALLGQTIETVKKSVDEFDMDTFKATTKDKLGELEAKLEEFANKVKESDQYLTIREGVVDLTKKVNDKLEEVKTKVLDSSVDDQYFEAFEDEIEDVEEKLDEMIEEIKD